MESRDLLVEGNIVINARNRHGDQMSASIITRTKPHAICLENARGAFWVDLPLRAGQVITVRELLRRLGGVGKTGIFPLDNEPRKE